MRSQRRLLSVSIAWLLVLVAAIEFLFRVFIAIPVESLSDIAAPYVSTRLWLQGSNPYNPHLFLPAWFASGAAFLDIPDQVSGAHSVYPPTIFPMFAPFAPLHWMTIVHLFLVVGVLLYAITVYGLVRVGWPGASWSDFAGNPRAVLFLAFAVGFAPFHTALRSRNIVLIASCLTILSVIVLLRRESGTRPAAGWFAAIATAASICMKPTTGVFVMPWLLRERRWGVIAGAVVLCLLLAAGGILPMVHASQMTWLASYRSNVAVLFTGGGNASVYPENTFRTDRIDLQLALFALTGNKTFSSILPPLIYAGCMLAIFRIAGFGRERVNVAASPLTARSYDLSLLVAAASLALGLVPAYAREYSAVVLLPLVLWCFRNFHLKSARWLLLLLCDFLVNTGALMRQIPRLASIAAHNQNLWDGTIGGHECWILVAIGGLLVWAVHERCYEDRAQASTPSYGQSDDAARPVPA
jgi:hypothetical protein